MEGGGSPTPSKLGPHFKILWNNKWPGLSIGLSLPAVLFPIVIAALYRSGQKMNSQANVFLALPYVPLPDFFFFSDLNV